MAPTAAGPINPELTEDYAAKLAERTKKVNAAYVDTYETIAIGAADLQEKLAKASDIEWVTILGSAQATLAREVTRAYATAARELIK